ncbi:hypothetical protein BGZ80_007447 [Entomortierella chlamydospora]|uniref:Uncharacterized protein n=1 Tax=Entomortierella chlamydospora TaxID=101097 RepID=A0A9P6T1Q3_9FUNG|nr:hypothetical protein BGZ80_007447 [Entomortierella chlamydospora]
MAGADDRQIKLETIATDVKGGVVNSVNYKVPYVSSSGQIYFLMFQAREELNEHGKHPKHASEESSPGNPGPPSSPGSSLNIPRLDLTPKVPISSGGNRDPSLVDVGMRMNKDKHGVAHNASSTVIVSASSTAMVALIGFVLLMDF